MPEKKLGIYKYPPKDWTLPDVRKYPPETWLSESCRAICAEARKMKLQEKLGNTFGAVVCGRDKKTGVPTRCPCVFDTIVDKEVVKWDECAETAYCIFMHELGHITQQSKEMTCNPKDPKPHAARGSAKAQNEFHKKIAKKELGCLIEAQKALMQNPGYSKEKKVKCTKYYLMARATAEGWK